MIINRLNVPFVNFQASPIGKQKESLELPFTGLSSDIITFRGKREDKNDKQSQLIKEPISLYVAKTAEDVSKSLSSLKNEERKDSLLMTGYNDTIPLIFFSENNRKTIVKAIIESTPDAETLKQMLTHQESDGYNALMAANDKAMAEILIKAAPDDTTLSRMLTAEHKKYKFNSLIFKLISNDRIYYEEDDYDTEAINAHISALIDAAPDAETLKQMLTQKDSNGNNALIYALRNDNEEAMQILIDAAPDKETLKQMLTQKDSNGNNALIYALKNDNEEAMQILIDHLIDWTGK